MPVGPGISPPGPARRSGTGPPRRSGTGLPRRSGTGPWRIERFDELDSTNRHALDAARAGAEPGLVVVAAYQTAGRGRLDRTWDAPPGSSLLVSVLLGPASQAHTVVTATAVALAAAVGAVAGIAVGLKWPNDLVVGDRKLAGILAEVEGDAVVVGAGCNVNRDGFGPELAGTATACNLEAGRPVSVDDLLGAFLGELRRAIDDPDATRRSYRDALVTVGRRVRVEQATGDLFGEALGVTDTGALVVRDDAGTDHEVVVGDVVHLRHE